jgi:nucleoside-diphosphate-sugar epimerase
VGKAPGVEGGTFNLGRGEEVTIGELAEMIIHLVGRRVEIVVDENRLRPVKSEVQRLVSDNRQALERFGWSPNVGLDEGLKATIGWMRKHLDMYRPGEYQV